MFKVIYSVKKYVDYFTSIKKQCQLDHIKRGSILFNNFWEANNTKRNNRTQIEFKLKGKCYEPYEPGLQVLEVHPTQHVK